MENVQISHTAELPDAALAAVRALCDAAFGADFADSDWDHALGGVHALRYADDQLVAHAALVARRFLHGGRSLRVGYLEAVAVAPDRRRRGHGAAVVRALHPYVDRGCELGALASSDEGVGLYTALGWARWAGPTGVLAPDGIRMMPEAEDMVFIRPVTLRLDPTLPLICDWRDGDAW